MSTQKRKISYWSFEFMKEGKEFFDGNVFCCFMTYLQSKDSQSLLFCDNKQNKAISIESIRDETKNSIHLYKVIFKSCKYNHSPDYMSSVDGSTRPTDKLLTEGDKELTHICFRIDKNEAYTILEERRNGVAIGAIVKYFNRFLKEFIAVNNDLPNDFTIWSSIVPPDDFITALEKTSRISCAELFVEKNVLGSDFLNLMEIDASMNNDIIVTVKSKPRQSLVKSHFRSIYNSLVGGDTKITRVRIRGKDLNKMNVMIDSLNGKKNLEITVELSQNGIVDSSSLFAKIEELMEQRYETE